MITCHLRYEIDPAGIEAFERFARAWMELVDRHGGTHHGYFLPSEGASDIADRIREESGCVRRYERSFLRPLLP